MGRDSHFFTILEPSRTPQLSNFLHTSLSLSLSLSLCFPFSTSLVPILNPQRHPLKPNTSQAQKKFISISFSHTHTPKSHQSNALGLQFQRWHRLLLLEGSPLQHSCPSYSTPFAPFLSLPLSLAPSTPTPNSPNSTTTTTLIAAPTSPSLAAVALPSSQVVVISLLNLQIIFLFLLFSGLLLCCLMLLAF